MLNILLGLGIVVVGVLIVFYSEQIFHFFGRVAWAEEHLGIEGGSRLFYKLIGLGVCFVGFLVMSGIWSDIARGFASIFIR